MKRVLIVGGAGFIGSHFTDELLSRGLEVVTYDNYSSGKEWHLAQHAGNTGLRSLRGNVEDLPALCAAMEGCDTVIHLASNPDIARAATDPAVDFDQGTVLTHSVAEAARITGAGQVLYASGSGVYGDIGEIEAHEDLGPLIPISTYGASKLAGEVLLASYTYMFGLRASAFRFGNVVGPRQTHGVGYDFIRRLRADSTCLRILGDGTQSKSYIHVTDVVAAVLGAAEKQQKPYEVYNVATGDYITVSEIAHLALECLGLAPEGVRFDYSGGNRGWKGDVPVVRLNTDRIRALGWANRYTSAQALRASMLAMMEDPRQFA